MYVTVAYVLLYIVHQSVEQVRVAIMEDKAQGKHRKKCDNAAIYGMASTLPPGPINEMLKTYTDVVLKA